MRQDTYDDLIARIRVHCRQIAQEARPGSGWARSAKNHVNWYNPERKTCLVLKAEEDSQERILAFPPATEQQIKETEQQLGFSLPSLLKLLYTQIANGGFGPGYWNPRRSEWLSRHRSHPWKYCSSIPVGNRLC